MRLAASYVAAFAAAVAVTGLVTYLVTTSVMDRRLDIRVEQEAGRLAALQATGGLPALAEAVRRHEQRLPNGVRGYAVVSQGDRIAGRLDAWPTRAGWSRLADTAPDREAASRRFFVTAFPDGATLAIAADQEEVEDAKEAIFEGFVATFGTVLVLGIAGSLGLGFLVLRRVDAIRRTAQAIIAGDLTQRIPVRGSDDDFDRLSQTLNQMLDRIGELMASLRQVSADIAHDLKSPLARLRRRLEAAQAQPSGMDRAGLDAAVAEVDEILATFSALLRIAQIEAGTRRAGFARIDLSETFATVAEAFTPAAEDAGKALIAAIEPGLTVTGDRELITQMLANLIENAIHHSRGGSRIAVALGREDGRIRGSVTDDGPGVPAAEREHIFRRFYRLPGSAAVPGSGLGLSLVKAVADLHGVNVVVADAEPGLRVVLEFPPQTEPGAALRKAGN